METTCLGACESHEHSHKELSRKSMLGGLAIVLTGLGLSTLGDTAAQAATAYKTKLKSTAIPVGSAKTITVRGISMLITRPSSSTYRAFKRVCSHEPKSLNTSLRSGQIFCAEHAQSFDPNTGAPIGRGPAKKALTKYSAKVKRGYIYVTV